MTMNIHQQSSPPGYRKYREIHYHVEELKNWGQQIPIEFSAEVRPGVLLRLDHSSHKYYRDNPDMMPQTLEAFDNSSRADLMQ